MKRVRLADNVRYFELTNPNSSLLFNTGKFISKGKVVSVGDPVEMSWNHGVYLTVPCEFLGNRGFLLHKEVLTSLLQEENPKSIIYVSHSTDMDYRNELYKPIRESELNDRLDIHLPHEKSDEPYATEKFLRTCEAIVAEASLRSTGQGLELGMANMLGVPIICIYKKGTKPAGSLKTVVDADDFYEYENKEDMIKKIEAALIEWGILCF